MTREEYVKAVNAAFNSQDFVKARQIGEAMVRDGIHNGYFQMAGADNMLGNLSQAEQEITAYLAQADDADGWLMYGLIRNSGGDYLKAAEFFDKAAERGSNDALGLAAAARFTYANQHVNDDPDNVDRNLLYFDLTEKAIVQSVQCIQKNPADYNYYGMLLQMLYVDYSMVAAGRLSYTHVESSVTSPLGTTERTSSNSYGLAGGSLWEMGQSLNRQADHTEGQKIACKNRAAQIAQILRDVGKPAEASLVMFEILFAEATLDGKGSSAPQAAAYYNNAFQAARDSLSDEAYSAWTEEFSDATNDYRTLMQKYGKRIREAQANGGQTKTDKAKGSFSLVGILYAVGKTPLIPLVLVLAGGLLAMFGRTAAKSGNIVGLVGLIIFGLILLIVGMVLAGKRNRNANPACLRVGLILLFVLSFLHIIVGIVAAVAAVIVAKKVE